MYSICWPGELRAMWLIKSWSWFLLNDCYLVCRSTNLCHEIEKYLLRLKTFLRLWSAYLCLLAWTEWSQFLSLMWVSFIQSVEDLNIMNRLSRRELFLPDCLRWDIGLFWTSDSGWSICPSSSFLVFRLELTPSAHLTLRPSDFDWNYTSALVGLQFANCRSSQLPYSREPVAFKSLSPPHLFVSVCLISISMSISMSISISIPISIPLYICQKWDDIFKVLKKTASQELYILYIIISGIIIINYYYYMELLYLAKLFFTNDGEIKTSPDKNWRSLSSLDLLYKNC